MFRTFGDRNMVRNTAKFLFPVHWLLSKEGGFHRHRYEVLKYQLLTAVT